MCLEHSGLNGYVMKEVWKNTKILPAVGSLAKLSIQARTATPSVNQQALW